eukprot:3186374-Amphidinium_carterae.1
MVRDVLGATWGNVAGLASDSPEMILTKWCLIIQGSLLHVVACWTFMYARMCLCTCVHFKHQALSSIALALAHPCAHTHTPPRSGTNISKRRPILRILRYFAFWVAGEGGMPNQLN